MSKPLNIAAHIVGSVLFLFYSLIGTPDWPNVEKIWNHPMGRSDIIFQIELLVFFYLNYYFLLEKFIIPKKYFTYSLIILVMMILMIPVTEIAVVKAVRQCSPPRSHEDRPFNLMKTVLYFLFNNRKTHLFLIIMFGSFLYKTRTRLKIMEKEKVKSELNFLKAQVNPHFLFNTLNSIYSLSIQRSAATPNSIVKLSSMMRYVLHDAQSNFVVLEKEINYIRDYIELQKLRLNESIKLTVKIEGDFSGKVIAPLILIAFLENAFKYGVNSEEESDIFIQTKLNGNTFRFNVTNKKVRTIIVAGSKTKLGIINAKRRLELIYPSMHSLKIRDSAAEYSVDLTIDLHA